MTGETKTMKVLRDASGAIFHIGDWNYRPQRGAPILAKAGQSVPAVASARGAETLRLAEVPHPRKPGRTITRRVQAKPGDAIPAYIAQGGEIIGFEMEHTYPLPAGVTEDTAEVMVGADGGLYPIEHAEAAQKAAMPSLEDRVNAVIAGGSTLSAMQTKIAAIKKKYPVPARG